MRRRGGAAAVPRTRRLEDADAPPDQRAERGDGGRCDREHGHCERMLGPDERTDSMRLEARRQVLHVLEHAEGENRGGEEGRPQGSELVRPWSDAEDPGAGRPAPSLECMRRRTIRAHSRRSRPAVSATMTTEKACQ